MSNEELIQNQEPEAPSTSEAELADKMIEDALKQVSNLPKQEQDEKPKSEEKPKGYERVEVDDPKVKDRIDYLYKQVKASDETNRIVRSEYQKIVNALEFAHQRIEDLTSKRAQEEESNALQQLRSQLKQAREIGDDDLADKYNEMIIDFKADQKLKQREVEQQKAYVKAQQEHIARQQQQTGNYSKDEVDYANSLRDELNEDGTPLRPWMRAEDKDTKLAQALAADIVADREKRGEKVDLKEVFQELDRIMFEKRGIAPKKSTPKTPEVLSGLNLTPPKKSSEIKLTDAERFAARKLNISSEQYAKGKNLAEKVTRISIDDF